MMDNEIKRLFMESKPDKNGKISTIQLHTCFKSIGITLAVKHVRALLYEYDKTKSKDLDLNEFRQLIYDIITISKSLRHETLNEPSENLEDNNELSNCSYNGPKRPSAIISVSEVNGDGNINRAKVPRSLSRYPTYTDKYFKLQLTKSIKQTLREKLVKAGESNIHEKTLEIYETSTRKDDLLKTHRGAINMYGEIEGIKVGEGVIYHDIRRTSIRIKCDIRRHTLQPKAVYTSKQKKQSNHRRNSEENNFFINNTEMNIVENMKHIVLQETTL